MNSKDSFTYILFIVLALPLTAQPHKDHIHEGVDFIVENLDQYDLIAIGETHDKKEVTDFYIQLISTPDFAKKVDFIVIEMGNHLYQKNLDDYISGNENNLNDLNKLWRDHTSCMLNGSDNTSMIRLLQAIRKSNMNDDHKIRVLAADPPINWQEIECLQEFYRFLGKRDEYYAQLVKENVVDAGKKGLLIMGNSHFNFKKTTYMEDNNLHNPITSIIETTEEKVYLLNIMSSSSFPYDKMNGIEIGSVIETRDSWLGELEVGSPFIKDLMLNTQTDGIIFLGKNTNLTREPIQEFNDPDYESELERRIQLPNCK